MRQREGLFRLRKEHFPRLPCAVAEHPAIALYLAVQPMPAVMVAPFDVWVALAAEWRDVRVVAENLEALRAPDNPVPIAERDALTAGGGAAGKTGSQNLVTETDFRLLRAPLVLALALSCAADRRPSPRAYLSLSEFLRLADSGMPYRHVTYRLFLEPRCPRTFRGPICTLF